MKWWIRAVQLFHLTVPVLLADHIDNFQHETSGNIFPPKERGYPEFSCWESWCGTVGIVELECKRVFLITLFCTWSFTGRLWLADCLFFILVLVLQSIFFIGTKWSNWSMAFEAPHLKLIWLVRDRCMKISVKIRHSPYPIWLLYYLPWGLILYCWVTCIISYTHAKWMQIWCKTILIQ